MEAWINDYINRNPADRWTVIEQNWNIIRKLLDNSRTDDRLVLYRGEDPKAEYKFPIRSSTTDICIALRFAAAGPRRVVRVYELPQGGRRIDISQQNLVEKEVLVHIEDVKVTETIGGADLIESSRKHLGQYSNEVRLFEAYLK